MVARLGKMRKHAKPLRSSLEASRCISVIAIGDILVIYMYMHSSIGRVQHKLFLLIQTGDAQDLYLISPHFDEIRGRK